MYIISLLSKFSPGPLKKYQHRKKTSLLLIQPVSWILDQTGSQIEQNTAPKPVFFQGCMVQSVHYLITSMNLTEKGSTVITHFEGHLGQKK